MKLFKRILIIAACVLLLLGAITLPLSANQKDDGFIINDFHITLNVNEDGSIDVVETLSVNFLENRHGIYFNLPINYEMIFDGVPQKYRFPITNIELLSYHQYEVDSSSEGVQVKVGSGDYYTDEYEEYRLAYTVHTTDLGLDDYSLLYFNLIYQWPTYIENFSFEINMFEDFDTSSMEFYVGNSGDNLAAFDYEVHPSLDEDYAITISGSYNDILDPNESITVHAVLPVDYFTYPDNSMYFYILIGASLLLLGISFIVFLKYGKDDELIVTVEFDPPKGVSSAECGYIIDSQISSKDITSLIIEWAKDGYLKIIEAEEGDLTFEKLQGLPDTFPIYQKSLFNSLFTDGDSVVSSSLKYKFGQHVQSCKQNLLAFMSLKKNRIYQSSSANLQVLMFILTVIPLFILVILATTTNYYSIITGLIVCAITILPIILMMSLMLLEEKRRGLNTSLNLILYYVGYAVLTVVSMIIMALFLSYIGETIWFILPIYIVTVAMAVITQRMNKRSKHGQKLYGQVLGLRQFIIYAEEDRLKVLASDNPYLFYSILPYAFAFDLSDVWTEHFKNLEIPSVDWYYSPYGLYNYAMIRSLTRNLHSSSSTISIPAPATRSGGGSGGGFGGGGGGFSGGGFGGSSGGSW